MNIFTWGALALTVFGLVCALVVTNLDLIEAVLQQEETEDAQDSLCQGRCL